MQMTATGCESDGRCGSAVNTVFWGFEQSRANQQRAGRAEPPMNEANAAPTLPNLKGAALRLKYLHSALAALKCGGGRVKIMQQHFVHHPTFLKSTEGVATSWLFLTHLSSILCG
jgi:hypothetical protein